MPTALGRKLLGLLNERGSSGCSKDIPSQTNTEAQLPELTHLAEPRVGSRAFLGIHGDSAHSLHRTFDIRNTESGTRTRISPNRFQEKFIFLMGTSNSLQLQQITSTKQCTRTFAADLREGYRKLRGFWRYWLSVYVFSHCEFFEFEKFGTSLFTEIGEGLPPDLVVPEYFYHPRPAQGPRPISPKEFQHIYYHHHTSE